MWGFCSGFGVSGDNSVLSVSACTDFPNNYFPEIFRTQKIFSIFFAANNYLPEMSSKGLRAIPAFRAKVKMPGFRKSPMRKLYRKKLPEIYHNVPEVPGPGP